MTVIGASLSSWLRDAPYMSLSLSLPGQAGMFDRQGHRRVDRGLDFHGDIGVARAGRVEPLGARRGEFEVALVPGVNPTETANQVSVGTDRPPQLVAQSGAHLGDLPRLPAQ